MNRYPVQVKYEVTGFIVIEAETQEDAAREVDDMHVEVEMFGEDESKISWRPERWTYSLVGVKAE